jgi:alpha-amylase
MLVRTLSVVLLLLAAAAPTAGAAQARAMGPAKVAAPRNDWARGAVFYEVFVRSFADSDGDGKGDLPGLIARLDHLNDGDPRTSTDLGVDAIWLMPVFTSPSSHGYDTSDYETINPDYGTNQDFARLCREAHRRGMKVIVDLVLNHTSSRHPWFQRSRSKDPGPYRDWYVWRADDPGWTRTWDTVPAWHGLADQPGRFYYGLFWEEMPDLNYRNPAVRDEAKRIARLWLERGADGFRLDAVRHLVETGPGQGGQEDTEETHAFLREFAASVRAIRPDAILVGEAWTEDTAQFIRYFGDTGQVPNGDELPVLFDFALSTALLQGLKSGDAAPIAARLRTIGQTYPKGAIDAPFLTNHDGIRVATELQGDLARLRTAAALLLTLPGAPFIYYGEELGLRQPNNGDDEFKRTPMPWNGTPGAGFTTGTPWHRLLKDHQSVNVEVESRDPASLLSRYRQMIRLRHASEALRVGELALLPTEGGVLAFLRRTGREATLVVHNLGTGPARAGPFTITASAMDPLFLDPGVALGGAVGAWTVTLPPTSSAVWRLRSR